MISVIDAIPGSGKTLAIIEYMKNNMMGKYLYITPTLKEAEERIPEALPLLMFKNPKITTKHPTKLEHMKHLVMLGYNIASTHSLFLGMDQGLIDLLVEKGYTLIIDEAIDCMNVLPDKYKRSDAYALLKGEFVSVVEEDGRGRIQWREDNYPSHDGQYSEIRAICGAKSLFTFMDRFLISEYPPDLLQRLPQVFVLTYMFEGCDMRYWLDVNNIPYEYIAPESLGIDSGRMVEVVRHNLSLLSNRALDKLVEGQKASMFSKKWYEDATLADIRPYKQSIQSIVSNSKIHRGDIFWTCFKEYEHKLKGKGYSQAFRNGLPSFVPKNIKATNDYKDCNVALHTCNVYRNPILYRYLFKNGIKANQDEYSVSELVQFALRGCIRQGKPQKLILLSRRMRELFEKWHKKL